MADFGTPEYFEQERQARQAPTVLRIGTRRRDGKYPVAYCFYSRIIRKVLTPEKLESEKVSGRYVIERAW